MEANNERLKELVKHVVLNYINNNYKVYTAYNNNIVFKYKDTEISICFHPYWNTEIDYCNIKYDNFTFENIPEEKNALAIKISNENGMTRDMKVVLSPVEYAMVCEEATKLAHNFETRMIYKAMSTNNIDNDIEEIDNIEF